MLSTGNGQGGFIKTQKISVIVSKKKKKRADGAAHGHGKVPQLEFAIGHLFFSQRDGKNRKRRVCERLDPGKDGVCAQFGEKGARGGGGKKNPCVCMVSRGDGG